MNDKECFDAVCALVPQGERITVQSGFVRQCEVLGSKTVYQYAVHASDVFGLSTKGYQDAFDVWKRQTICGRERKIADLKKQLSDLERAEVEA